MDDPTANEAERLIEQIARLRARLDPAYQMADDYGHWHKNNEIQQAISSAERELLLLRIQGPRPNPAPLTPAEEAQAVIDAALADKRRIDRALRQMDAVFGYRSEAA